MKDTANDELIREFKNGNQKAFDEIFKKYYVFLCREARGYFRSSYLAEEIVCDVFLRIWRNREVLNISISLKEYLVKAVHNNCTNYYRIQKAQEQLKQNINNQKQDAYSLADIGQNPLDYMINKELEEHLMEAIENLPPRYKEAFMLSRFKDLTYEEIATEMGISVNGVKQNIKKSLAYLREKLADYLAVILTVIYILKKN